MKSVCVTKSKAYYIIADGYTECYTFNSREEAESFIELFKPFSLKYRQENTIAIREMYRINTDIIIREIYPNVD